jgi:hypothetical protein
VIERASFLAPQHGKECRGKEIKRESEGGSCLSPVPSLVVFEVVAVVRKGEAVRLKEDRMQGRRRRGAKTANVRLLVVRPAVVICKDRRSVSSCRVSV